MKCRGPYRNSNVIRVSAFHLYQPLYEFKDLLIKVDSEKKSRALKTGTFSKDNIKRGGARWQPPRAQGPFGSFLVSKGLFLNNFP